MDECKDAVEQALGRPPTDKELEDIASAVQERMRKKMAEGLSKRDAAAAVERDISDEAKRAKAIARADAYNNILKFADLNARTIEGEEVLSEKAVLAGRTSGAGRGFADSVDSQHRSLREQLFAPAINELRRLGLLRAIKSKDPALDRDVARELYRRKDPTLGPDTGNVMAKQIAGVLGKVMDSGRAMMNEAGAFIGEVEGYMGRQYHDMLKVRGKGPNGDFDTWRDKAMRTFDLDKMYPDVPAQDIEDRLRQSWKSISTGVFDSAAGGPLSGFEGGRNVGRKVSQERSIIFRDADAWLEYNATFGKGSVMDAIWAGGDSAARDTAVMQKFGTNPEAMFAKWHANNIDKAKARGDMAAVDALKGDPNRGMADFIFGKNNHPANMTVAQIGATVRNVMQLKSLGGVVLSTISDIPMVASTLRHNGVPYWQGLAQAMSSLLPQGERSKEIATALGAGIDGYTGHIVHRFRAEDGSLGAMSGAVNKFYDLNGLNWETDAMKAGAGRIISNSLANHSGQTFEQLDRLMQNTLRRYGIEAKEWDVARAATKTINEDSGRAYLMPSAIEDKAVSQKVWNLITDQIAEGMNEPSAAARYFATGYGTRSGTIWGEAIRSMTQFKGFTYTFMQRHGGRTFGRDGVDYPGAVYLLAGMTLAGAMTNMLTDVIHNKTPALPTDAASSAKFAANAMQRGGAAGFYGDMLFGQSGTGASDVAKQFFGPAAGPVLDAASLFRTVFASATSPGGRSSADTAAAKSLQILKQNMPNIPFVKGATDYIILHYLQEAVAPGSVARYERAVRKNGQSFILPLSQ